MMRRYTFKLYPTPEQATVLHEQRMMMADLWNALKQRHEDTYRRTRGQHGVCHDEGRSVLTFFDLAGEITNLRRECPEWAILSSEVARGVAKRLTNAYAAFFRRVKAGEEPGYPRWQRRDRASSIPLGPMGVGWALKQREDNPLSWRLHYKSLTSVNRLETWLHARGRLPVHRCCVIDWRTADLLWRDNRWWLSVCLRVGVQRDPGRVPTRVELNLLDRFARVNGMTEEPPGLFDAQLCQDQIDELKSERDRRWPRGTRRDKDEERRFQVARAEIRELAGLAARQRNNALHVWTAKTVSRASDLTVIAPAIREETRSPRGDARSWGANVAPVSELNRHVLSQAPALAVQMLVYKAEEAGIRCDVVTDETPIIAVGGDLITAGKILRRARRKVKEEELV